MILARCQIEQAYAFFFDIFPERMDGVGQCRQQLQYFHNAFLIAGNLLEREEFQKEKRDLLLYRGLANERLSLAYPQNGEDEVHVTYFEKAITDLQQCLQMSTESDAYTAWVWCDIGAAFEKSRHLKGKCPGIWEDPSECFEEALALDPDSIWSMERFGIHYYKVEDFERAAHYLDQVIDIAENMPHSNPLRKCWGNALYYRAKICITESKSDENGSFDILMEAKDYLRRAGEHFFSACNLVVTGEVCHLLSKNQQTRPEDVDRLLREANQMFLQAAHFQNARKLTINLYLKWGRCLKDETRHLQRHPRDAIEAYKMAFDTGLDSHVRFLSMIAKELLYTMLGNYKDQNKPPPLREEIAFWFVYISNHLVSQPDLLPFEKLKWKYAFEILEIMEFIVTHITNITTNPQHVANGMLLITVQCMTLWHTIDQRRLQTLTHEIEDIINNLAYPRRQADLQPDVQPRLTNSALHDTFTYDFCIINDEDHDIDGWVKYSLLTGLESELFGSGLKGFYNKGMKLGQFSYRRWEHILEESAHVLIVLSHDLNDNQQREIAQIANDKGVVILKERHVEVPFPLHAYPKFDFTCMINVSNLARYLMPIRAPHVW